MADALSWIIDATLRPPSIRLNSIERLGPGSLAIGFEALPNLDYSVQLRPDLSSSTNTWSLLQEFGGSPVNRFLSVTTSISGAPFRYYRLWAKP